MKQTLKITILVVMFYRTFLLYRVLLKLKLINIFIAFLNINEVDKFWILGNRKQRVVNEVRSQNSEVIFVTGIRAMLQKYCALKGGVLDPYYF